MKRLYINLSARNYYPLLPWSLLCVLLLGFTQLRAQDANLTACNTFTSTNWIAPTFSLTATGWTDPTNAINNSTSDFATTSTSGATLRIADDVDYTSAGYFVGVHVGRPALTGGGNVIVKTFLGVTQQDSYTVNVGGGVTATQTDIGFYTSKPFNAIEIQSGSGNDIRVYYVFLQRFCSYDLPCNTNTTFTRPNFPAIVEDSHTGATGGVFLTSGFNNDNLVDNNPATVATFTPLLTIDGEVTLSIKDPVNNYPGGTYAGFDIENNVVVGLGILNRISFKTYKDGNEVETIPGNSLLVSLPVLSGSGRQTVGFVANAEFDEVQILFTQPAGISLGSTTVYSAILREFCEGTPLACNTSTLLNQATQPVLIDPNNTGTSGLVCVNCNVSDASNAIDGNASTAASISLAAGLGTTASLAVKKQLTTYPASTTASYFVGFDIENPTLVGANLLNAITIQTLLNGTPVQTVSTGSGAVSLGASFLSGTGRQTVGFVATSEFNGIKITLTNVASLNLGQTKVYSAIVKKFCNGPVLACPSSLTTLSNSPTGSPVYINSANTGIGSLGCVGCTINNSENVINGSATPATIVLNVSAASSAKFSVANALDTYPAETFAGFEIGSSTLANLNLAGSVRITLYNNGSAVQSGAGTNLLAGATLLTGDRQIVGTVAQVPFDEIQIEFNQIGSVNPLGTISIYRAVVQKGCATAVACNQTRYLTAPDFSAVIEGTRTGFSGVASVGSSSIRDPWNVVSASTTDFARIVNIAGGLVQASISVADPADVYPVGTFAGFTINKGTFLASADLLQYLTVTTYLNGVQQESRSNNNLLDLTVFVQLFGTASNFYNVGFVTTKPFDEIQLSVGSVASVLQVVDVYGAFVDTRTSANGGSLVCNFVLNPDFNVTTKNVPVSGNVSTNDIVPSGTTYGTPVASGSNPAGATITLNPNGTYNFTATNPGSYTYSVPVCAAGQTTCPITPLIITVLDATVTTNKPVANPDYASVQSSTAVAGSVTINVRANDGPGNTGGTLGLPTITTGPAHGTATVNGSGTIDYTPATGFVGDDILTYQVCESPGGLCATAQVTIHVVAPGSSTVSVDDDYAKTLPNTPVSGNLLTNDIGSGLTVSNTTTVVNSSGTLVLTAAGSYTFTPASGVTGPVDFTYTACDNSTTAVCGTATLHILVVPIPDLTPVVYFRPTAVYNTTNITLVVDVAEINSVVTSGQIRVLVTKDAKVSLSFNSAATSVGGRSVQNSVWAFDESSNVNYYILTTSQSVAAGNRLSFGFTGTLTPGATTGKLTTSAVILGGTVVETRTNNNTDADKTDYFQQ